MNVKNMKINMQSFVEFFLLVKHRMGVSFLVAVTEAKRCPDKHQTDVQTTTPDSMVVHCCWLHLMTFISTSAFHTVGVNSIVKMSGHVTLTMYSGVSKQRGVWSGGMGPKGARRWPSQASISVITDASRSLLAANNAVLDQILVPCPSALL